MERDGRRTGLGWANEERREKEEGRERQAAGSHARRGWLTVSLLQSAVRMEEKER